MLSNTFARFLKLGPLAAALLFLPQSAFALTTTQVTWVTDNSVGSGVNEVSLTVGIQCSPNSSLCSGAGLQGNPYLQTQVAQLEGTGTSTLTAVTGPGDTITMTTFNGTADTVIFTGLPTALAPGGVVAAIDPLLTLITQAIGSIEGFSQKQDGQIIPTSLDGGEWGAIATTNSPLLPEISLSLIIDAPGTLAEVGTNASPQFELRDLRGTFFFLTATQLSSVVPIVGTISGTIRTTFRATFTLNLSGVSSAVPEPGTFALIGMGILAFGAAAARRRS